MVGNKQGKCLKQQNKQVYKNYQHYIIQERIMKDKQEIQSSIKGFKNKKKRQK